MSDGINGQGALHALPAQADPAGELASGFRALLPQRSWEDKLAEIIRVRFGVAGQQREVVIPVLPTRPNREWKERFRGAFGDVLNRLAQQGDGSAVMGLVAGMSDEQLELLRAYDRSGALPPDEWLEENATDSQILSAFLGVTAAAFPLADMLLKLVRESPDLQSVLKIAYLRSTSSALLSGDGDLESSKTS